MEEKLVLHDVVPLSKSSIFTILRSFYSGRTGLVNNLYIFPNKSVEPRFFACSGSLNNISLFTGYEQEYRIGGAGITRKDSLISAFGEALERYSASIYSFKDLIFDSYDSLTKKGFRALDPLSLHLFTKEQYQNPGFFLVPLQRDMTINWVWGHSLVDFEPILVPASMVYIPYVNRNDEPYFNHIVSTGLGFGFYKEEAILSGLHEVIERDCFSIAWLSKTPLPRIDIKATGLKSIDELVNCNFGHCIDKYTVFDMTNDLGIPAFLGIVEYDDPDMPSAAFGAACNVNKGRALMKTLVETAQSGSFAKYLKDKNIEKGEGVFTGDFEKDIINFDQGVLLYSYHAYRYLYDFLSSSSTTRDFSAVPDSTCTGVRDSIQHIVSRLHAKGYEPIAVEVTADDIKPLGASVYRVVIPGLVQLNGEHRYRFLGNDRIRKVPHALGYFPRELNDDELNTYPHGFP